MVKKLIIHIGYPKTATTTLQDGLFVSLHNQGIINYFGKSEYAYNEKFNYARKIGNDLFLHGNFKAESILLSNDVAKIIFDEFRDNNAWLVNEFRVQEGKLEKYGYI